MPQTTQTVWCRSAFLAAFRDAVSLTSMRGLVVKGVGVNVGAVIDAIVLSNVLREFLYTGIELEARSKFSNLGVNIENRKQENNGVSWFVTGRRW